MHWLGAVIFSHTAAGAVVLVVVVVLGVVFAAVVDGGSVAVVAVVSGEVELVDDACEHAASTPNIATAIAATRLTWRSRHRSTIAVWSPEGRARRR